MSASKKKRMGSQRRPLNQNLEESPETSDTAKRPPDAQSKHRADAKGDLSLSPGKSQSEIPARNKKLSSRRVNKDKVHFKDVTTEASHEPLEEVEDVAASSQSANTIVVENERIEIPSGGTGAAESDLLLNRPPNADTSITQAISDMPQISDISDTSMETISDFVLNLPESISNEEGVLTEKNITQQMPEILDATSPATGVTGESISSVRLIYQGDINSTGSHIEENTGGERAGHIEKPVHQQSEEETSLPATKIKKLGSRRRIKDADIKTHTEVVMAVERISAHVSETSDTTIAQLTQDDTPTPSEGQTLDVPQKIQSNEPDREFLINIQDLEETNPYDFETVVPSLDLSDPRSIAISSMDDTTAHQSVPHPKITVNLSAVDKVTKVEACDFSTQNILEPAVVITNENLASSGISTTTLKGKVDLKDITDTLDSTEGMERAAKEFKGETLDSSCLLPFEMEMGKSLITDDITNNYAVTELCEPVTGAQIMESSTGQLLYLDRDGHSDSLNASVDIYGINTAQIQKDNKSEETTDINENLSDDDNVTLVEQEESLLTLDNYMLIGQIDDKNKKHEENLNESQFLDREDRDLNAVEELSLKVNIDSKENVNIGLFDRDGGNKDSDEKSFKEQTGRSCENVEDLTELGESRDKLPFGAEEEIGLSDEVLGVLKSSETQEADDTDVSLISPDLEVALDVQDVATMQSQFIGNERKLGLSGHVEDVKKPEKSDEIVPPITVTEATQIEPIFNEKGEIKQDMLKNKDFSQLVYVELEETDIESDKDVALSYEKDDLKVNAKEQQGLPSLKVSKGFGNSAVKTETSEMHAPIDVYNLTGISDNETHEEMETSALQQPKQEVQGEPSELDETIHQGPRRKLGSSRRIRAKNPTVEETSEGNTNSDIVKDSVLQLSSQLQSDEILTPITFTEKTQMEEEFQEKGEISAVYEDEGFSQLVDVEPQKTAEEVDNEASLLSEMGNIHEESEENRLKHDVGAQQLILPNEEMISAQRLDLPAATEEWEYQSIQLDNKSVPDEVYGDEFQQMEINPVQILHSDITAASFTSPHPETPFSDKQFGDMKSSETQEDDDTDASLVTPDLKVAFDVQDLEQGLDTISVQVHNAAVEKIDNQHLTPTEVAEDNVLLKNIPSQTADYGIESVISEKPSVSFSEQESSTEAQNSDQSDVKTEVDTTQGPINVYSLTCISDTETYEEVENSSLTKPEVQGEIGEPSEAVKSGDVTEDNDNVRQGPRRKLGSSRRVKTRNPESTNTYDITHESKEFIPSEDLFQELVSLNLASVATAELAKEDLQTVDTELSSQDKNIILEGSIGEVTHQDVALIEGDVIRIKGLKEEAEADATFDIDILRQHTRGGSEEVISANFEDTPSVLTAVDDTHTHQGVQNSAILEVNTETPINTETNRRSQLNQSQGEERPPMDDAAVSEDTTAIDEKDVIPFVKESYVFTKQEDDYVTTATKDEQPNKDAERNKIAPEDKEVLEAEVQLIKDINMAAPMQSLDPIICEEIQPSSPGKRRKMGSTRRNLTFNTSPPEEIILPIDADRVVESPSNENTESREQSGLLIPTVSVHKQPPDEETPLSQESNQEKSRLELETSSHPDVLAEEAAVARKRRMGSNRKPHTDQITRQQQHSDERLLHPLESTQQRQTPKVDERDSAALNIKGDSRSVSQRIPHQRSHPSTNVRLAQQQNINLAAGYDQSARKYEVVMIGDSSVGKTSFMQRAQSGNFSSDIPSSIGMDSYKWTVDVDGVPVVLHLWDTAGQERFHSMTKQLFHRGQAFLLMYDISCRQTFTAVSYWANCIKDGAGEDVVILLLGNKCDTKDRKVRREEGEVFAQENGFNFMECSAVSGNNVVEALETVARLLNQKVQKAARREEPLMLRKPEPRNKGCC